MVKCVINGIFYEIILDHFPISGSFKYRIDSGLYYLSYVCRESWTFSLGNKVNFRNSLDSTVWDIVYASNNANIAYDNCIVIFSSLFNKHFPLVTKKFKVKDINKPYITNDIKDLTKQKNILQKKFS